MKYALLIMFASICGCHGPLGQPYVKRLNPEEQRVVNDSWLNMLSPPDRLDRGLLLDVILSYDFHSQGVDRLNFTSEKNFWGGRVIMNVYFDREHRELDEFTVTFIDARGKESRRERLSFDEVESRSRYLFMPAGKPCTQPAETAEEREERQKAEQLYEERMARQKLIMAATRPAGATIEDCEK